MKRAFITLLAVLLFVPNSYAASDSAKGCVKEFYRMLMSNKDFSINEFAETYSITISHEAELNPKEPSQYPELFEFRKQLKSQADTHPSFVLRAMRRYKGVLTQGYDYSQIKKLIDSAEDTHDGNPYADLIIMEFSNEITIYFEYSWTADFSDNKWYSILNIWLPNGDSMNMTYNRELYPDSKPTKQKRPSIIRGSAKFINVYKSPDENSPVVDKFVKDEIFYFTPVSGTNWYPVYRWGDREPLGYIRKTRIKTFPEFPPKLQQEAEARRKH